MDTSVNVAIRPDGNYQIGSETLNAEQLNTKLDELAKSGFSGNFKLGDALTMDLAGVKNLVSSGGVKSTELTLPAPTGAGGVQIDPEVVDKKLASFASLMSDVFKLIAENASTERKSAREGRHAAQAAEQANLSSQVDKLKDAADKAFEAALIQGVIGIATGVITAVVSIASAGISIGGAAKAVGAGVKGATDTAQQAMMKIADGISQAVKTAGDTFSQVGNTSGEMGAAGVRMESDQLQADAKEEEAQSKVDSAMAADENEFMQNYQEMQREIRQKMAGIIEAQNATLSNLARA